MRLGLSPGHHKDDPSPGLARRFNAIGHEETFHTRNFFAATFLAGDGIEVGALHQPLRMPPAARVKYVDRMSAEDLRRSYADLAGTPLVDVDIIDDGETLRTVASESQDFVVANHFIEHCQNPILTFQTFFRVLKAGGRLFAAVPDKRYTFDVHRPCTSVDHIARDFAEGPEWSERGHVEEWSRLVNKTQPESLVQQEVAHLLSINYSIHYHVWDAVALMGFLELLRHHLDYELEVFMRNGFENILILRKDAAPAQPG